jgi:hypothetical protein
MQDHPLSLLESMEEVNMETTETPYIPPHEEDRKNSGRTSGIWHSMSDLFALIRAGVCTLESLPT